MNQETRQGTIEFERELIQALRGEVRKLNERVDPEKRNSGMILRVAAGIIGQVLGPTSEEGRRLMDTYLKDRPKETIYTGNAPGTDPNKGGKLQHVSIPMLMGEQKRNRSKKDKAPLDTGN